ncbi:hypothetical protein HPB52_007179 [Rhipicephalus sanguineus]|uniref:GH18 domain-containing protein n=1 Tax=Rhipicephalus sanguineus TaxID=34632 RepID=A0A9D4PEY7_RHISA|nr:hypothetical protein HPB52_007179 [Rhipicephalus sanguineus]
MVRDQNLILAYTPHPLIADKLIGELAVPSSVGPVPLFGYLRADTLDPCYGVVTVRSSDSEAELRQRFCWPEGEKSSTSGVWAPPTRYWRLQDTYLPALLPLYYCSAIVLYGYAIDDYKSVIVWKYPTAKRYVDAVRSMKVGRQLLHRGNDIPVYFAVGGAREDSANLSKVAANIMARQHLAEFVHREVKNLSPLWAGVNVDWNHPGDQCSPGTTSNLFLDFIKELKNHNISVMISISPVKSRLTAYSLGTVAGMVDYIIIKTHTHVLSPSMFNVVRCSGDQSAADDVYTTALSALTTFEDKSRLGYSISVAPETFIAPAAQLGAPVLGTTQWDNHTRQPGRTSYASVCQKPVIRTHSHPLCLMVARPRDNHTVHVATFSDERALMERMNLTYSNEMAMAPVAVFDIDLDDFTGTCGNGISPLIRAVATGPG